MCPPSLSAVARVQSTALPAATYAGLVAQKTRLQNLTQLCQSLVGPLQTVERAEAAFAHGDMADVLNNSGPAARSALSEFKQGPQSWALASSSGIGPVQLLVPRTENAISQARVAVLNAWSMAVQVTFHGSCAVDVCLYDAVIFSPVEPVQGEAAKGAGYSLELRTELTPLVLALKPDAFASLLRELEDQLFSPLDHAATQPLVPYYHPFASLPPKTLHPRVRLHGFSKLEVKWDTSEPDACDTMVQVAEAVSSVTNAVLSIPDSKLSQDGLEAKNETVRALRKRTVEVLLNWHHSRLSAIHVTALPLHQAEYGRQRATQLLKAWKILDTCTCLSHVPNETEARSVLSRLLVAARETPNTIVKRALASHLARVRDATVAAPHSKHVGNNGWDATSASLASNVAVYGSAGALSVDETDDGPSMLEDSQGFNTPISRISPSLGSETHHQFKRDLSATEGTEFSLRPTSPSLSAVSAQTEKATPLPTTSAESESLPLSKPKPDPGMTRAPTRGGRRKLVARRIRPEDQLGSGPFPSKKPDAQLFSNADDDAWGLDEPALTSSLPPVVASAPPRRGSTHSTNSSSVRSPARVLSSRLGQVPRASSARARAQAQAQARARLSPALGASATPLGSMAGSIAGGSMAGSVTSSVAGSSAAGSAVGSPALGPALGPAFSPAVEPSLAPTTPRQLSIGLASPPPLVDTLPPSDDAVGSRRNSLRSNNLAGSPSRAVNTSPLPISPPKSLSALGPAASIASGPNRGESSSKLSSPSSLVPSLPASSTASRRPYSPFGLVPPRKRGRVFPTSKSASVTSASKTTQPFSSVHQVSIGASDQLSHDAEATNQNSNSQSLDVVSSSAPAPVDSPQSRTQPRHLMSSPDQSLLARQEGTLSSLEGNWGRLSSASERAASASDLQGGLPLPSEPTEQVSAGHSAAAKTPPSPAPAALGEIDAWDLDMDNLSSPSHTAEKKTTHASSMVPPTPRFSGPKQPTTPPPPHPAEPAEPAEPTAQLQKDEIESGDEWNLSPVLPRASHHLAKTEHMLTPPRALEERHLHETLSEKDTTRKIETPVTPGDQSFSRTASELNMTTPSPATPSTQETPGIDAGQKDWKANARVGQRPISPSAGAVTTTNNQDGKESEPPASPSSVTNAGTGNFTLPPSAPETPAAQESVVASSDALRTHSETLSPPTPTPTLGPQSSSAAAKAHTDSQTPIQEPAAVSVSDHSDVSTATYAHAPASGVVAPAAQAPSLQAQDTLTSTLPSLNTWNSNHPPTHGMGSPKNDWDAFSQIPSDISAAVQDREQTYVPEVENKKESSKSTLEAEAEMQVEAKQAQRPASVSALPLLPTAQSRVETDAQIAPAQPKEKVDTESEDGWDLSSPELPPAEDCPKQVEDYSRQAEDHSKQVKNVAERAEVDSKQTEVDSKQAGADSKQIESDLQAEGYPKPAENDLKFVQDDLKQAKDDSKQAEDFPKQAEVEIRPQNVLTGPNVASTGPNEIGGEQSEFGWSGNEHESRHLEACTHNNRPLDSVDAPNSFAGEAGEVADEWDLSPPELTAGLPSAVSHSADTKETEPSGDQMVQHSAISTLAQSIEGSQPPDVDTGSSELSQRVQPQPENKANHLAKPSFPATWEEGLNEDEWELTSPQFDPVHDAALISTNKGQPSVLKEEDLRRSDVTAELAGASPNAVAADFVERSSAGKENPSELAATQTAIDGRQSSGSANLFDWPEEADKEGGEFNKPSPELHPASSDRSKAPREAPLLDAGKEVNLAGPVHDAPQSEAGENQLLVSKVASHEQAYAIQAGSDNGQPFDTVHGPARMSWEPEHGSDGWDLSSPELPTAPVGPLADIEKSQPLEAERGAPLPEPAVPALGSEQDRSLAETRYDEGHFLASKADGEERLGWANAPVSTTWETSQEDDEWNLSSPQLTPVQVAPLADENQSLPVCGQKHLAPSPLADVEDAHNEARTGETEAPSHEHGHASKSDAASEQASGTEPELAGDPIRGSDAQPGDPTTETQSTSHEDVDRVSSFAKASNDLIGADTLDSSNQAESTSHRDEQYLAAQPAENRRYAGTALEEAWEHTSLPQEESKIIHNEQDLSARENVAEDHMASNAWNLSSPRSPVVEQPALRDSLGGGYTPVCRSSPTQATEATPVEEKLYTEEARWAPDLAFAVEGASATPRADTKEEATYAEVAQSFMSNAAEAKDNSVAAAAWDLPPLEEDALPPHISQEQTDPEEINGEKRPQGVDHRSVLGKSVIGSDPRVSPAEQFSLEPPERGDTWDLSLDVSQADLIPADTPTCAFEPHSPPAVSSGTPTAPIQPSPHPSPEWTTAGRSTLKGSGLVGQEKELNHHDPHQEQEAKEDLYHQDDSTSSIDGGTIRADHHPRKEVGTKPSDQPNVTPARLDSQLLALHEVAPHSERESTTAADAAWDLDEMPIPANEKEATKSPLGSPKSEQGINEKSPSDRAAWTQAEFDSASPPDPSGGSENTSGSSWDVLGRHPSPPTADASIAPNVQTEPAHHVNPPPQEIEQSSPIDDFQHLATGSDIPSSAIGKASQKVGHTTDDSRGDDPVESQSHDLPPPQTDPWKAYLSSGSQTARDSPETVPQDGSREMRVNQSHPLTFSSVAYPKSSDQLVRPAAPPSAEANEAGDGEEKIPSSDPWDLSPMQSPVKSPPSPKLELQSEGRQERATHEPSTLDDASRQESPENDHYGKKEGATHAPSIVSGTGVTTSTTSSANLSGQNISKELPRPLSPPDADETWGWGEEGDATTSASPKGTDVTVSHVEPHPSQESMDELCQISIRTKSVLAALDELLALHSRVKEQNISTGSWSDLSDLVEFDLPSSVPSHPVIDQHPEQSVLSALLDALDIYTATLPATFGQDAASVPALAAQFTNDCATVAVWIQQAADALGVDQNEGLNTRAERVMTLGRECFENQLVRH